MLQLAQAFFYNINHRLKFHSIALQSHSIALDSHTISYNVIASNSSYPTIAYHGIHHDFNLNVFWEE